MKRKTIIAVAISALALATGFGWAASEQREAVEFHPGHTHEADGSTVGAPEHSGGTDRFGCHNASVPYHCH